MTPLCGLVYALHHYTTTPFGEKGTLYTNAPVQLRYQSQFTPIMGSVRNLKWGRHGPKAHSRQRASGSR